MKKLFTLEGLCNLTDMMLCGNTVIRSYIQSTKNEYASERDQCLPDCVSWGYSLDDVTYNEPIDPGQSSFIRKRFHIADDLGIFKNRNDLFLPKF